MVLFWDSHKSNLLAVECLGKGTKEWLSRWRRWRDSESKRRWILKNILTELDRDALPNSSWWRFFLKVGKGTSARQLLEKVERQRQGSITVHGPLVSQLLCDHKLTFDLLKNCVSVSHHKGGKRARHHRDLAAWTSMERWRSQFENENQTQPSWLALHCNVWIA